MLEIKIKTVDENGNKTKRCVKSEKHNDDSHCADVVSLVYDLIVSMGYNQETVRKYIDIDATY